MAKATNFWSWKDSELAAELERRGIKLEKYNRKEAVNAIKLAEVEGEVRETRDHVKDMKDKGIDLRRVIFHSIGEQDIPYVFVGHNGRGYYIPKEVEVEVPFYILNSCIRDAVEDRLYPATMRDGSIEWKSRKVQRYPYSYVE